MGVKPAGELFELLFDGRADDLRLENPMHRVTWGLRNDGYAFVEVFCKSKKQVVFGNGICGAELEANSVIGNEVSAGAQLIFNLLAPFEGCDAVPVVVGVSVEGCAMGLA